MLASAYTPDYATLLWEQRMEEIDLDRARGYRQNWEYYNGSHKQSLPVRTGQADDNVIINLPRLIVDKGASFLFGKEVEFQLEEGVTTKAEKHLDDVWRANRKMTFLGKVAVSGGIYGHAFIKIVPDGLSEGLPRLVSIEPENMAVYYDGDDIEHVWRYRIQWISRGRDGGVAHRRQTINREADHWEIINEVLLGGGRWKSDPDSPDMRWKWSWPPIIDCQNIALPGVYYGLSDLEDLSGQDAINYLASKIQRIIRYHAHPKTYAGGVGVSDLKVGPDDILFLPGTSSWIKNLEMQSDLASSMGFMDRLISWSLATARIPRLDPAQINVGALSGFALKVLYGDLLEKTETKRRTYGDMLVELNRRLSEMKGHGPDNHCTLLWPYPLPVDEAAEEKRDGFDLDYELASKSTVRARRGLDEAAEEKRMAAEKVQEDSIGSALLREFETQRGVE